MDNGTGTDKEELRRRIESIERASWSVCVEAGRVLVEAFGMPPDKRLALSRAERRERVQDCDTGCE